MDSAENRRPSDDKGSLFTASLCKALTNRDYGTGTLDNVLDSTKMIMEELANASGLPPHVLGE
jgi:hypothetical protein